ncbi:hypothetical protein G8A07_01285 [Roseateles sp. DAIF2]|uniref:hypothetical protein n=1 Tax=Roseateles sp. DAIF2 TaxID=2714952 RepID=UPI0018A269C9|nr:hypothetical protein [Roseateles sp. DAIF2]QPF71694.1 hypothetical protein G8A07_01285 [Roseateles sp. DAIF2]
MAIPLRELYVEAKSVAVVEVVEGRTVSAKGKPCGARYKGRVVHSVKNAAPRAVIEFGYVPSLKIGTPYLLLLGDYIDVPLEAAPEFHARCKSVLPSTAVIAHWRGAMEIVGDTGEPGKRETWTVRPPTHVVFPLGARTTAVHGEKQFWFNDLVKRMAEEP